MAKKDVVLELVKQYDRVRTEHSALTKTKDELSTQIKACIGDADDIPVEGYRVSYRHDADKEVTKFDAKKMEKKNPGDYKLYLNCLERVQLIHSQIKELSKEYTHTETVTGPRRLVITQLEEEL